VLFGLSACYVGPTKPLEDGGAGGDGTGGAGGDGTGGGGPSSGFCQDRTADLVNGSGIPSNPAPSLSETPDPASACNAVERAFASESATHVVECTELDYTTNPPCTGMHYPYWPEYGVYDDPVPRGFLVHALEHGAVTLAYSCTDCAEEVDAAVALLDEVGDDPECSGISSRTILTPDPRLETRWAAASWGFTLTADCFEPDIFRAFIETHRGNGLEEVCGHGIDVSRPPP
jgi:hypothetical protein